MKTILGQGNKEMDTKEMLEELYRFHFVAARKMDDIPEPDTAEEIYERGKADGNLDAIGTIYLSLYGGKALYDLWQDCLKEAIKNGEK